MLSMPARTLICNRWVKQYRMVYELESYLAQKRDIILMNQGSTITPLTYILCRSQNLIPLHTLFAYLSDSTQLPTGNALDVVILLETDAVMTKLQHVLVPGPEAVTLAKTLRK